MNKITIENLEHLHHLFRGYRSHNGIGYWFRGHADVNWLLVPKAGRDEFGLPSNRDLGRFKDWRDQAASKLATVNPYLRLSSAFCLKKSPDH